MILVFPLKQRGDSFPLVIPPKVEFIYTGYLRGVFFPYTYSPLSYLTLSPNLKKIFPPSASLKR